MREGRTANTEPCFPRIYSGARRTRPCAPLSPQPDPGTRPGKTERAGEIGVGRGNWSGPGETGRVRENGGARKLIPARRGRVRLAGLFLIAGFPPSCTAFDARAQLWCSLVTLWHRNVAPMLHRWSSDDGVMGPSRDRSGASRTGRLHRNPFDLINFSGSPRKSQSRTLIRPSWAAEATSLPSRVNIWPRLKPRAPPDQGASVA